MSFVAGRLPDEMMKVAEKEKKENVAETREVGVFSMTKILLR